MKKIIESITDLMLFSALVEHKSFTSLADKLNVNKSVISKRIKNLENLLGTQLLIRSTRRLNLTEAGSLLYNRSQNIAKNLEQTYAELADLCHTPSGTLRLSAPNNFAQEHLIPLIAEFVGMYPAIKFKLLIGRSYQCIIQNSIDIGFHVGPLPDSNLIARKLTSRKMQVCASPHYFKQNGMPDSPEDLKQHNCLCFLENTLSSQWVFQQKDRSQQIISVKGNFNATSNQVLKSAAINHLGIVMLPEHIVIRELRSGQLVPALQNYETNHVDIYALYAPTRHLARRARLFLDFINHRFNSDDYWK